MIKKILKSLLPKFMLNVWRRYYATKQIHKWQKDGSPFPPPHVVKQKTIKEYRDKYRYSVLVETGTCFGEMVEAQRKRFKKIISVELDNDLFAKAKQRLSGYSNVTVLQGDSGKVLPEIMKDLREPAIFWLDGHYSGGITARGDKDCPVFEEVDAILTTNTKHNHVLLVDDARCFVGADDYPTIDELTAYIKRKNESYQVTVKDDIIRYVI